MMRAETAIGYTLCVISGLIAIDNPTALLCAVLGVIAGSFIANPDWYKGGSR